MMTKAPLLAAFVALFTVVGCAAERDGDGEDDEAVEANAEALTTKAPTPFCLPGEVRKCTLGPPPVCRCEPINPPILQSYVAQ